MDDDQHHEDHRWVQEQRQRQSDRKELGLRVLASVLGWAAIGAATVVVISVLKYLGLSVG